MSYKFYMPSRDAGKRMLLLYDACDTLIENCPYKKIEMLVSEQTYEDMKNLPETFFRGRWMYIRYKDRDILVKKFRLKISTSKPIKINKNDPGIWRRINRK